MADNNDSSASIEEIKRRYAAALEIARESIPNFTPSDIHIIYQNMTQLQSCFTFTPKPTYYKIKE